MNYTENQGAQEDKVGQESQAHYLDVAEDDMLDRLMGVCLQEIKAAPEIWTKLSVREQEEIIYRVEKAVRESIRQATRIIESEGREHAYARVDYVKFKDGEATAVLKGRADAHMHLIAAANGPVLLILSAKNRDGESHSHRPDDRQGGLELESGDDFKINPPEGEDPEEPEGEPTE